MKKLLEPIGCVTRLRREMRSGFTVLEVCVVTAILGILAAVALPAISAARESSRRVRCASNLRQVMMAFHSFEQTHHSFPGIMDRGIRDWGDAILPYLDQPELVLDAHGVQIHGPKFVPVYRCGSDPLAAGLLNDRSYWMNIGTTDEAGNGMYHYRGRRVRAADVTDGLSATVAIAERLVRPDIETPMSDERAWRHRIERLTSTNTLDPRSFGKVCEDESFNPRYPSFYSIGGYVHVQTPNKNSCTNGPRMGPVPLPRGPAAFTTVSGHPGGVNVAMADGAVQFITDDIDYDVWWQMGSRDGTDAPYDH